MPARSTRSRAGRFVALSITTASLVGLGAATGVLQAQAKGSTVNPATGCSEDSFFGGAVSPDNGSPVTVALGSNQTFSVVYHDETSINTNPGFAAQYSVTDSAGHVVQSGAPASSPVGPPAGTHDKFNTLLSVNFGPSNPGAYTLTIKAWDGDQNKAGGDCGTVSWALDTPAPPTTAPPTTIPHGTTTTTQPPGTTTTTEPSTPQTNVLGETFAQTPTAGAISGTPALTG